jgi:hypothetical protein
MDSEGAAMVKFYVFDDDPLASPEDAHTNAYDVLSKHGEATHCPVCNKCLSSLPLLPPVRFELDLFGHYFADVAFTGGDDILISDRLRDLSIRMQLVGLHTFLPAEIVHIRSRKRKLVNKCPRYFLASISRSRTAIDTKSSEFEWESGPECLECRQGGIIKRWSRIIIEPGTWAGEDIFYARGLSGTIIVTERFRDMYLEHGFRNGVFIPAEEFGHDFYPWEKTSASN